MLKSHGKIVGTSQLQYRYEKLASCNFTLYSMYYSTISEVCPYWCSHKTSFTLYVPWLDNGCHGWINKVLSKKKKTFLYEHPERCITCCCFRRYKETAIEKIHMIQPSSIQSFFCNFWIGSFHFSSCIWTWSISHY